MKNCNLFKSITFLFLVLISVGASFIRAEVIVDGTQAERGKIALWLTSSLGTTVTIGADGKINVAGGGNVSATRLRNMTNDAATSVTIDIVKDDATVSIGGWNVDANDKTTGTQTVDIGDLEKIGNVINSYGLTPGTKLMHEITEVYEGKKNNWSYNRAHAEAVKAEKELMNSHNTDWFGPRYFRDTERRWLTKIKRPDGSYVVTRVRAYVANEDIEWCREKTPCETHKGLIAIADPDPQVYIFSYDFYGDHLITEIWDTQNSFPTGVAYDSYGSLYVTEDLEEEDKIRIFDPEGNLTDSIYGEELVNPEGIDVDRVTGDIFVAVETGIVRYAYNKIYLGLYDVPDQGFDPTDVAVWRNDGKEDIYGGDDIYAIFVTDRWSGQVYGFNVDSDMNANSYTIVFGIPYLSAPEGLTVGSWGLIWVASTGNDRIYCFTPNGNLCSHGEQDFFVEDTYRTFFDLEMLDFDGIYVVDETPGEGELLLYDFYGNLVRTYGTGTLQCPYSIDIYFGVDSANLEPHPNPTLSQWGIIIFSGLFILFLIFMIRRKRLRVSLQA